MEVKYKRKKKRNKMMNPVHMDQVRMLARFSYDGAKDSLVMDINSSSLSSDRY